jgi:lipopolysaccharide export system permease protein
MQFVWKYIDDLVGKGLEWTIILELMFYVSATLLPMALPLAILLASIMTFGNLAESYELTALKSAGMSLMKVMKPLVITTIFMAIGAFLFSNYVLPVANLKMGALLYDVTHQKPTLEIKEGVFYSGIQDFAIKAGRKDKKTNTLYDLLIYDHSQRTGNNKVILAERAEMRISEDGNYLVMTLFNGNSYEEVFDRSSKDFKPHLRVSFKEEKLFMDMSDFKMVRTDETLFKDNYQMLNIRQLEEQIDTLKMEFNSRQNIFLSQLNRNFNMWLDTIPRALLAADTLPVAPLNFYDQLESSARKSLFDYALNSARSHEAYLSTAMSDVENTQETINRYFIEWHKKFTLSFACIILFFIGAPLGAIIRKGGLGLPMVMSVLFFLLFHILTITGEKFAREGVMPPFQGAWMASSILLPLGFFLTYKATRESALFSMDAYRLFFKKLFRRRPQA